MTQNSSLSTPVDLRSELTPVKDQEQRNTCAVFATTATHEHHVRPSDRDFDLSEEWLNWACKALDGSPPDSGLSLRSVQIGLAQTGQPLEREWPYNVTPLDPQAPYSPPSGASAGIHCYKASLQPFIYGQQAVIDELRGGKTVLAGVRVGRNFMLAPNGQIPDAAEMTGTSGHAVVIVGWTGTLFIFRNSWGLDWGDQGYGYFSPNWLTDNLVTRTVWVIDP